MALTANLIPSQFQTYPCPYDAMTAFCSAQNIGAASGYVAGNVNTILDLGGGSPVSAAGRYDAIWSIDITSLNFATADESYTLRLLGSNDVNFANGNVEQISMRDFAATAALRNLTAVLGATPTIPATGVAGTIVQVPITNLIQRIYYRYLKLHMVVVGTGPAFTCTSWISRAQVHF